MFSVPILVGPDEDTCGSVGCKLSTHSSGICAF